jgi:hypothetical protein
VSWDIALRDASGDVVGVPRFTDGGTFPLGGSEVAELNVTYNYGKLFSFGDLHGCIAKDTIPVLEGVVERCGATPSSDYWECTKGNVGRAALRLLTWAKLHPLATWEVS